MMILYFILTLFLLITVHEYGHFIVARLCGVKVLKFSFGFGKKLVSWTSKKGTEYVWSILPFGGYVQLLGMDDKEYVNVSDKSYSFKDKSVFVRIFILLAGPLFNFLFAFFAFWLVFIIGIHSLAPIITKVLPNTQAFYSGIKSQTEILAVNGKNVHSWRDVHLRLMPYIGKDRIIKLDLQSIKTGKKYTKTVSLKNMQLSGDKPDFLSNFGLVPFTPHLPTIVGKVLPESPAYSLIKKGDEIISVNQKPVHDWLEVVELVKSNPDTKVDFIILREQKNLSISVVMGHKKVNNELVGWMGIASKPVYWPTSWLRLEKYGFWKSASLALQQTINISSATINWVWHIIKGSISVSSISGPLGIAQGAQASGHTGFVYYLVFLALVSISLGILNLLPIPILDGGHLIYCLIELVKGKPLSDKTKTSLSYLGIVLLVIISIIAVNNDLNHFFLTE